MQLASSAPVLVKGLLGAFLVHTAQSAAAAAIGSGTGGKLPKLPNLDGPNPLVGG